MQGIKRLYREGKHLKVKGLSLVPRLFIVEQFGFNHYFNDEIFQWIDTLAHVGANGMRVFGFWPFGRGEETEPYLKVNNIYDLNQFNEEYFTYLKRWALYAYEKGIYIQYELFDSCGFWQETFLPFNVFYHYVRNHLDFSNVENRNLVNIQKRYIQKVIDTLEPEHYQHIIFGVMNEFKGNKAWHKEMSQYIKSLTPNSLVSGSEEDSYAANDPNTDIWACHTGTYDFKTGTPNIMFDMQQLRQKTGEQKILGYSTDGFGVQGMFRETENDMRRLVQDINRAGLQIFSFLDQKAYKPSQPNAPNQSTWPGSAARLNIDVYETIVQEFQPQPRPTPTIVEPLPDGYFDVFECNTLPSTLKEAYNEWKQVDGKIIRGKAIKATYDTGFLVFGQYKTGYPQQPLKAYFSILVDNNTADDRNLLILDVYDHYSDRVIGKQVITRKDFVKAGNFCLFEFDFIPPSLSANMEFRVYYMGHSYVLINKIAIVNPLMIVITDASGIPDSP